MNYNFFSKKFKLFLNKFYKMSSCSLYDFNREEKKNIFIFFEKYKMTNILKVIFIYVINAQI